MKVELETQLSQLPAMKTGDLRQLWGKPFGNPPHPKLRRELLIPILAYRMQEKALGGIKPILKALGIKEVRCTFAIDDEAHTYNKNVNHMSHVGQHFMILKALENGVGEERLAEALSVDVGNIRKKRDLLNGICPEAIQLLRNNQIALEVFSVLRKMKPVRQVEAAEHMIAGATFSTRFAKSLLAVTRSEFLLQPIRKPKVEATSLAAREMLGKESEQLVRDLKAIEDSYGRDVLTLTICSGYLRRMLANSRVERHLSKNHPDLLDALKEAVSER